MALSACEKYLKRHPQSPLLQAFKANLLVQLGKDDVGIALAKALCATGPCDLDVLLQLEKVFILANDCMHLPCTPVISMIYRCDGGGAL